MPSLYTWRKTEFGAECRTELMLLTVERYRPDSVWEIVVHANGKYARRRGRHPQNGTLEEAKALCVQVAKQLLSDELNSIDGNEEG